MKVLTTILFLFMTIEGQASILIPQNAYTFDFNVKTFKMSRMKEEKLLASIDLLRQVFSSPEFKHKIFRHRFREKYAFAQNRGLTNAQIYRKILSGVEKLYPYDNNAMDVEIEMYSDYESKVLGFTRPSTKRIWMNTKYFNKHTKAEVASHLTHEWLHKLGFDHERERCHDRKYSVPYAIGYIVKEIAGKLDEDFNQKESKKRQRRLRFSTY
jgi:hypothetical protein